MCIVVIYNKESFVVLGNTCSATINSASPAKVWAFRSFTAIYLVWTRAQARGLRQRRRGRRRRRRWRQVSAQVPAPGCFGLGVGSWRKWPRQVMCPKRHCHVQHRNQTVASTQALAPECYDLEVGSWRRWRQTMRVKRHCHLQHQSLIVASQDTWRHQLNAGMQLVPTPRRDSQFLPRRGTRAIWVSLRPCLFLDSHLFCVPRKNLYVV